jgi:hypothetical protein
MMKSEIKNGVRKPREGSVNRRVWDISDEEFAGGKPLLRRSVLERCGAEGINLRTASVEHCVWRRYTGLVINPKKGKKDGN